MKDIKIGFIGFGEVAAVLTKVLNERKVNIVAHDILPKNRNGVEFLSLREVVTSSKYILSTVTTQVAKDVAQESMQYLQPGQIYVDLNSTAPSIKIEINKIIEKSGADFVEGVILGAIGVTGGQTHILTGGIKGPEVARFFSDVGLNVSFYKEEIGKASMFKMLRSIFSKGLEALLLELLIAGKRAGIVEDLWKDITELMNGKPFEQIASNWIQTHAVAYKRRYYEMIQVTETIQDLGIDPLISSGTKAFFERSLSLGFQEKFLEKPDSIKDVIGFMEKHLFDIEEGNKYEENNSTAKSH